VNTPHDQTVGAIREAARRAAGTAEFLALARLAHVITPETSRNLRALMKS
jgi:hypothetical protein